LEEELSRSIETPAIETQSQRARFHTFSSLRHLDYRYLWSGTLMMSAGQWVQQVTLGWLLYDLTGNSMLLGALNGLRAVPFLVTGRSHGSPQAIAQNSMDFDYHGSCNGHVGGIALLSCGSYFCFHLDYRSRMVVHGTGAPEHDSERRSESGSG
jgi:hypothetical protein